MVSDTELRGFIRDALLLEEDPADATLRSVRETVAAALGLTDEEALALKPRCKTLTLEVLRELEEGLSQSQDAPAPAPAAPKPAPKARKPASRKKAAEPVIVQRLKQLGRVMLGPAVFRGLKELSPAAQEAELRRRCRFPRGTPTLKLIEQRRLEKELAELGGEAAVVTGKRRRAVRMSVVDSDVEMGASSSSSDSDSEAGAASGSDSDFEEARTTPAKAKRMRVVESDSDDDFE